jgi:hypothetical protein
MLDTTHISRLQYNTQVVCVHTVTHVHASTDTTHTHTHTHIHTHSLSPFSQNHICPHAHTHGNGIWGTVPVHYMGANRRQPVDMALKCVFLDRTSDQAQQQLNARDNYSHTHQDTCGTMQFHAAPSTHKQALDPSHIITT